MSATRESARALYKALGCSDSGCPFRPRGGMRTNAGCRCHEIIEDALTRERAAARAEAEKALLGEMVGRQIPEALARLERKAAADARDQALADAADYVLEVAAEEGWCADFLAPAIRALKVKP